MSASIKHIPTWLRRALIAIAALAALLVVTLTALRVYITTDSGRSLIERQINQRSFGPIERMNISGLSGDPLKSFAAKDIKIYDKDGLWLSGKDLKMDWSPWALLRKNVDIQSLKFDVIDLARKPVLNSSNPSKQSAPTTPYSFNLETANIRRFRLSPAIIGQSAEFSFNAKMSTGPKSEIKAVFDVARADIIGDEIHLDFTRNQAGDMSGEFEINGAAGGALAALIRAPETADISGKGQINGTAQNGAGDITISFGNAPQITADVNWSPAVANLKADVKTHEWELFNSTRAALGDNLALTASLDRLLTPAAFNAAVTTQQLNAEAAGRLNPDGGIPKTADIFVSSENISGLVKLPDGFNIAAGQINGRVETAPSYKFTGDMRLGKITSPYGTAASISGPISLTQNTPNQYQIGSDVTLTDLKAKNEIPLKLAAKTRLTTKAAINTETSQISDLTASLSSASNQINLSGRANYSRNLFDLKGTVGAALLSQGNIPAGELQSRFAARTTNQDNANFIASGGFKPDSEISAPYGQFFNSGLNFDIDISTLKGGFDIHALTVSGDDIKAAISGQYTDRLNIDGEAVITAPFNYAPLSLPEQTSASFTITGTRENPNIRLDARTNTAIINGYSLNDLRLRSEINDATALSHTPLRLTANTEHGTLDLGAVLALNNQTLTANNIELSWGRLMASGNLTKPPRGPVLGEINLNLPQKGDQFAKAALTLSNRQDIQAIDLTAEAKNIAIQDWAFDQFTAQASGDLSALSGQIDVSGQHLGGIIERAFAFKSPLAISRSSDGGISASLSPHAEYGNIILDAAEAITADYKSGDISLRAPITLGGAAMLINYEQISGRESFALSTQDMPVTLFPLPASLADTRGRIKAEIKLSGGSDNVNGGGRITLSDWRGFDGPKGEGVSGALDLNLSGSQLGWELTAQSPDGFSAKSNGALPLINAQSLTAIRPDMRAPLSGQFTASGEAAALLGLVTPNDANPGGQIEAQLGLSGTLSAPNIDGSARGQALQMEAPQLGTQLRQGRFTAEFTNDSLSVTDVFIMDGSDGNIKGQGAFKLGEFGRPLGELKLTASKFRALDRKDYEGRFSGDFGLKSTQAQTTLIGDIKINQAEVKQFVKGRATVVEIDVEEINKPETARKTAPRSPKKPVLLDMNITAPRRVFVRTNGLDVELSINAQIKGNLSAPEIYGNAAVVRGGYKLAGRELAFEEGRIDFNGALGQARVNLTANTDTQNISAALNITGTVETPVITLSSVPKRPQDEILSALLYGRSTTELSPIEAAQLAGTLAQFSGLGGGFNLIGGLRDALGIGHLSIGTNPDGSAQITGGRYLARNVYLQIFSGGGAAQSGAVIDWEIRKNIALSSRIEADNDQSFSLKWKKDF